MKRLKTARIDPSVGRCVMKSIFYLCGIAIIGAFAVLVLGAV